MKKKILFTLLATAIACMLAIAIGAAAPMPQKPDLGVDFGEVTTIEGFVAPSELYAGTTERVLLKDGENYVTYPTYYVTKNNTTFDFDFSKLNSALGTSYDKKAVVMVEIPNGVTTISNSYFAGTGNFPVCVSVQVPGSVTSYGANMFQTNTVIRSIEFLDGTEPVTMGDGMFSSNWSVGTTNLEYVKLPNNLVSIGNNAFGKSHASKTIILGASLKTVGANFFGESTPDNKETNIYASDNFFADADMLKNLFGGYDQYHNNVLKITLFYAGSQESAQALVDKGLAVQTGYVWSNAKFISASEYDYEKHKNNTRNSITIVYDVEGCDVFYGGHNMSEDAEMQFDGYFNDIKFGTVCTNSGCGCAVIDESKTISAMFKYRGYSFSQFKDANGSYSVSQGFVVNPASVKEYVELTGNTFVYGVLATVNLDDKAIQPELGGKVQYNQFDKLVNKYFDIKVSGITEDVFGVKIVFCAYVIDGGKMFYLDDGLTKTEIMGVSYSDLAQ